MHRLRLDDSGRTIRVHVGDIIRVRLPGGSSGGYHRPKSTATPVRRTWATGGYPGDEDARAHFVADHHGRADLVASDDYACLHTTPRCMVPQRLWVVHVRVHRG